MSDKYQEFVLGTLETNQPKAKEEGISPRDQQHVFTRLTEDLGSNDPKENARGVTALTNMEKSGIKPVDPSMVPGVPGKSLEYMTEQGQVNINDNSKDLYKTTTGQDFPGTGETRSKDLVNEHRIQEGLQTGGYQTGTPLKSMEAAELEANGGRKDFPPDSPEVKTPSKTEGPSDLVRALVTGKPDDLLKALTSSAHLGISPKTLLSGLDNPGKLINDTNEKFMKSTPGQMVQNFGEMITGKKSIADGLRDNTNILTDGIIGGTSRAVDQAKENGKFIQEQFLDSTVGKTLQNFGDVALGKKTAADGLNDQVNLFKEVGDDVKGGLGELKKSMDTMGEKVMDSPVGETLKNFGSFIQGGKSLGDTLSDQVDIDRKALVGAQTGATELSKDIKGFVDAGLSTIQKAFAGPGDTIEPLLKGMKENPDQADALMKNPIGGAIELAENDPTNKLIRGISETVTPDRDSPEAAKALEDMTKGLTEGLSELNQPGQKNVEPMDPQKTPEKQNTEFDWKTLLNEAANKEGQSKEDPFAKLQSANNALMGKPSGIGGGQGGEPGNLVAAGAGDKATDFATKLSGALAGAVGFKRAEMLGANQQEAGMVGKASKETAQEIGDPSKLVKPEKDGKEKDKDKDKEKTNSTPQSTAKTAAKASMQIAGTVAKELAKKALLAVPGGAAIVGAIKIAEQMSNVVKAVTGNAGGIGGVAGIPGGDKGAALADGLKSSKDSIKSAVNETYDGAKQGIDQAKADKKQDEEMQERLRKQTHIDVSQ